MIGTLSLIGTYRKELISLLYSKSSLNESDKLPLIVVLSDGYVKGMPLHRYLLVTFYGDASKIIQCILKISSIYILDDPNRLYRTEETGTDYGTIVGHVYGTDFPIIVEGKNAYKWSMSPTRVIEYKPLDTLDAPLFINWYWLSSSIKRKFFKI
jgi:hypothetical protein